MDSEVAFSTDSLDDPNRQSIYQLHRMEDKMAKKVVKSETKDVGGWGPFRILPGPNYETKNTHSDGTSVKGYGDSKSESKRDADSKSSSSGGCFLTTACVESAGLPDNCHELTTLRKYRDEYVSCLPSGDELLKKYYSDAPRIVDAISHSEAPEKVYGNIFSEIQKAIFFISKGENEQAFSVYQELFSRLSKKYLPQNE